MTIFGVEITVINSLEDLENVELQSIEYRSLIWRTEVELRGFTCHHAFLIVKVLGWSIGIWLLHVKGGLIAFSSLHCFGRLHRMYSNGRYDTFLNMPKILIIFSGSNMYKCVALLLVQALVSVCLKILSSV